MKCEVFFLGGEVVLLLSLLAVSGLLILDDSSSDACDVNLFGGGSGGRKPQNQKQTINHMSYKFLLLPSKPNSKNHNRRNPPLLLAVQLTPANQGKSPV